MTKIHMTKLALLGATAFLGTTSARAQVADSWAISTDVIVSALNTSETTDLSAIDAGGSTGVDAAEITAGFKNSISASAVGASASSAFTSLNNSANAGEATIEFGGIISVTAGNSSAVTNSSDLATSATIGGGAANSISLAAVGSSASVGGSTTLTNVGGDVVDGDTFSYTAGQLTVASGDAAGEVDATDAGVGGNSGAVTLTLATGVNTPTVSGIGNSISVAGVGSSASASFSAAVGGDGSNLDSFNLTLGDTTAISAANGDDGAVTVNLTDAGLATPGVTGGNGNAISAAAIGASASFALGSSTYDSGIIGEFNASVGELTVDATNGENTVSLASTDGAGAFAVSDALIAGTTGNGNSISASAVGSSGSVSYANTVFDGGNGAAGGEVTFADITVTSTNNGAVTNLGNLVAGTIEGGSKNSIGIAGIGASASQSISTTDYSGAGITAVSTTVDGAITLAAANVGTVLVAGGLATPVITDGFSNSISAAAVGASASQSVTRTLVGVAQ